jgi:hypothetical protein
MYPRRKVHLPALAMACVVALGVTLGVPLAMQQHAGDAAALAAAAPHTDGRTPAVVVATRDDAVMAPGTIRIEVVAQKRPTSRWWSSLVHLPTT